MEEQEERQMEPISTHGFYLWFAWTIMASIQIASNRYFKCYWWVHMWIHRLSGVVILAITLWFGLTRLAKYSFMPPMRPHHLTGTFIVLVVSVIAALGIIGRSRIRRAVWNARMALAVKYAHKYLAWTLFFVSQIQILLGWYTFGDVEGKYYSLITRHNVMVPLFLTILLCSEVGFQFFKRQKTPFIVPHETMSVEEFNFKVKMGEPLVVLNDLVLNVGNFMGNHPGGLFLLEHNIGRDVSKFFYGGYSLEPESGLDPHTHSNVARTVVNTIAVAKLVHQAETFTATIQNVDQVNSQTKTITLLTNDGAPLKEFYPGLDYLGKHYLISAPELGSTSRHYTVSNVMKKSVYEEYVRVASAFVEQRSETLSKEALNEEKSASFTITVKNYNITGGLSRVIHQQTVFSGAPFTVQGPMGRGLSLLPDGTHVAFAAGTGVLVFVDLVAYLLRLNMGQLAVSEEHVPLGPSFKFVLYVSFHSREEAVALELLEAAYRVTNKLKLDNFQLIIRLTHETIGGEQPRWAFKYIERSVEELPDVRKVYACGPPVMNEHFDKVFELLQLKSHYPKSMFEVL